LKTFSIVIIIAAVLSCVAPPRRSESRENGPVTCEVRDGKIARIGQCLDGEVPSAGVVRMIYRDGNEIYYLSDGGEEALPRRAGYRDLAGGASHDMDLPSDVALKTVRRLAGAAGAAFVLACPGAVGGGCGLYRLEFNTGKISVVRGVRDVALFEGKPVVLGEKNGGFEVNLNGITVPLTVRGDPRFGAVSEGRLISITGEGVTEVVDLTLMRSVHAWSDRGELASPGEHNLAIEVLDAGGAPSERMLYYKVFVDGKYSGRTTTGPAQQARRYGVKVDENEYHILRLERWELHEGRQTYERVNNIGQPAPLRIYMPQNRLIKLLVTREKGKYRSLVTHAVEESK